MTLNIPFKQISVVVQGAINKTITPKCLQAIRKQLPGAKIILSTWCASQTEGLDYDEVVLCPDPGGVLSEDVEGHPFYNNTNRLIFGTQEGLKKVTTPYTLKLRSDIILHDANFLAYWDQYPARDSKYNIFEHRVLNYYLFTPQFGDYNGQKFPTLFHPSDWMFFGLTEDIKLLFSVPLQPDPEYSLWWQTHQKPAYQIDCWPGNNWRYSPEQYLFYTTAKKKFPHLSFEHYLDVTREKEDFSRRVMVNNFVILDYRQWHISMPKYQHTIGTVPYGQTSHAQWQEDYKTYCDPSFRLSWRQCLFKYIHLIAPTKLALERKLILGCFSGLYKRHIYKKYGRFPLRLKYKLSTLEPLGQRYVYNEDKKDIK